jgi:membrane-bound inhibitor of C-type lysozyme
MDCITAKRNLRRAQRQEEARKRNQLFYNCYDKSLQIHYNLVELSLDTLH